MRVLRKTLLANLYSLLLCALMLAGTTFAWMTDAAVSGNNRILAGNLDLEVEYMQGMYQETEEAGAVVPWQNSMWETIGSGSGLFSGSDTAEAWLPGEMKYVVVKLHNAGDIALDYDLYLHKTNELTGLTEDDQPYVISNWLGYAMTGPLTFDETLVDDRVWGMPIASPSDYTEYQNRTDLTAIRKRIVTGSSDESIEVVKTPGALFSESADGASEKVSGDLDAGETEYINMVLYLPVVTQDKTGADKPYIDMGLTVLAKQKIESDDFEESAEALQENSSPKMLMKSMPVSAFPENCMVQYVNREKITLSLQQLEELQTSETPESAVPGFGAWEGNTRKVEVSVCKTNILYEEDPDTEKYVGVPGLVFYRNTAAAKQKLNENAYAGAGEDQEAVIENTEAEDGTPESAGENCYHCAVTMDQEETWPANAEVMCYSFRVQGVEEGAPKSLRFYIGKDRRIRQIFCEDQNGYEEDLSGFSSYDPVTGVLQLTTYGDGTNLLTILQDVVEE